MIFKRFFGLALCLAFLLVSCGEDTSQQQEEYNTLFKEVLHVHDKLMARMTDIYEYSKALKNAADTSATPEKYLNAREKLQQSDARMMRWMEHFGDEFVKNKAAIKTMKPQQLDVRMQALRQELDSVNHMQATMTERLDHAQNLIE